MSPWIHAAPVLVVAIAGLVYGTARGCIPRWRASLRKREDGPPPLDVVDMDARVLVTDAARDGHASRWGLDIRREGSAYHLTDAVAQHTYPSAAACEEAVARRLRGAR